MAKRLFSIFVFLFAVSGCTAESGEPVNPLDMVKLARGLVAEPIKKFLAPHSPERWMLLGADGRVLDADTNASNHLGQSAVLLAPPQGASPRSQATSLLIARAVEMRNPEVVTVTLGVTVNNPLGVDASTLFLPQARITWGSGSADAQSNVAIVDIVKGTQVTVLGNVVQVDGIYNAPLGVGALHPDARFSASLAYGTRGSGAALPTFTDLASVPARGDFDGTATFVVPNFARDVTIFAVDLTTGLPADLGVRYMIDDAGTTILAAFTQNEAAAPNTVFPKAYPLPGWIRAVQVTNASAHVLLVSAVYGLAL